MDEWKQYACSYRFGRDRTEWDVTVSARSADEAAERLRAIGAWGKVDGELVATIRVTPERSPLALLKGFCRSISQRWIGRSEAG